jgi:hypothetical protein
MDKEEKEFLKCFKLMMMEGIIMRKKSKYSGFVFRKYYINLEEEKVYWETKRIGKQNYFTFEQIYQIHKNINHKFSKEYATKKFVIEIYNLNKSVQSIILECADEHSRNVIMDGFLLLHKEFKYKKLKKRNRKD